MNFIIEFVFLSLSFNAIFLKKIFLFITQLENINKYRNFSVYFLFYCKQNTLKLGDFNILGQAVRPVTGLGERERREGKKSLRRALPCTAIPVSRLSMRCELSPIIIFNAFLPNLKR